MASVARVGDLVTAFRPPGFQFTALANGAPVVGFMVVPKEIVGAIRKGSEKLIVGGRGVAHLGDPVVFPIPIPPVLTITGSLAGTLTIDKPLSGTIERASGLFYVNGRGIARVGDPVLITFEPMSFAGTLAGSPFTGLIQIVSPVRGIIRNGSAALGVA